MKKDKAKRTKSVLASITILTLVAAMSAEVIDVGDTDLQESNQNSHKQQT